MKSEQELMGKILRPFDVVIRVSLWVAGVSFLMVLLLEVL